MSLRGSVHIETVDYMDLPTYGVRANRDTRRVKMPPACSTMHPTHTVEIVFKEVTFRTNVRAADRPEAERKAMQNLRYTFWPESRLRAVGPIRKVNIYGA